MRTIADDKLYQPFYSDSMISEVVKFYETQALSDYYLRALLYQGIVRLHLELPDTVVHEPLKKAEGILLAHPEVASLPTATRIYFYLGRVNQDNGNFERSYFYYGEAVKYAQRAGDDEGVVAASLAMFWEYLRQDDFGSALSLLKRLDEMRNISLDLQYDIINARGGYHLTRGEYGKALTNYKQLEKLSNQVKGKPLLSHFYYSIAKIHGKINEPDSALFYAKKAIENIADTSFKSRNYYLYTNLANIAQQQGKYELASTQYKKAFELLLKSMDAKTEKRIYELEKKYDLSRAQNKVLRQRERYQRMMLFIGIGLAGLLLLLYTYRQRLKQNRLRLENEKLKVTQAEAEMLYAQQTQKQSENLLSFYRLFSQRERNTYQRFERLSQKYIQNNKPVYN